MGIYYMVCFFLLGTIMGSFFNVVGDRLPNNKSIVYPPSHCENCNHRLGVLELIPIFSFFLQGGKCKNCKIKLSIIYPFYEVCCGLVYMLCYVIFGMSFELLFAITFSSILLIIIISDCNYYIIPDSVLLFGLVFLFIEKTLIWDLNSALYSLLDGLIAFIVIYLFKLICDLIFRKETMGGGDLKLLFVFGFVIGWEMALLTIFFGAIVALPISLIVLYKKKNRVVPFGPFLTLAALNVFYFNITFTKFIELFI